MPPTGPIVRDPQQTPAIELEETFTPAYRIYVLILLMGVNLFNYMDRSILGVLIEPIKEEMQASDTQMEFSQGLRSRFFTPCAASQLPALPTEGYVCA